MAGISDYVRVALDGVGKRILNLKHVDWFGAGSDGYQQLTGIADPTDPSKIGAVATTTPGSGDAGQVTREAPDNYDSGIFGLTNAYVEIVVGTPTRVTGMWLCNLTAVKQDIYLTNSAGNVYENAYPLQPSLSIFIPMGGVKMVGIRIKCGLGGVVNAQMWGKQ